MTRRGITRKANEIEMRAAPWPHYPHCPECDERLASENPCMPLPPCDGVTCPHCDALLAGNETNIRTKD